MSAAAERLLVTGAAGCLGAWVIAELLAEGAEVVAFDLAPDNYRLRLICEDSDIERLGAVVGDITDFAQVLSAVDEHGITGVIHLAALQVPFCRADPPYGALVNVVGTVNVFEAVARRTEQVSRIVYASSTGVFGRADRDLGGMPWADARPQPSTHYGVYKLANEGTARVYREEHGIASIGLRPYVIYGPGRDQGLSSAPSKAMLAAAVGRPLHIPFGGAFQVQYARDAARAFIAAARADHQGAAVCNLPGPKVRMGDIVAAIEQVVPAARGTITVGDGELGLPEEVPSAGLADIIGPLPETPLLRGVEETIGILRRTPYEAVGRDTGSVLAVA